MAKPPVDEDAHFRIDELERKMAAVPNSDHIAGVVSGAVNAKIEEMRKDIAEFKAGVEGRVQSANELTLALKELVETLKTPVERTSTVHLPSGPVSLTTHEHRH